MRRREESKIDEDQRQVGVHAVEGEHAGIDRREDGNEKRRQVVNGQPAANGAWIAFIGRWGLCDRLVAG